ncbi:MAG: hypothetical protein R3F61_30830 [Myxococcota bacterium]
MNRSVLPLVLATLAGCATKTPAGTPDPSGPAPVVETPESLADGHVTYDEWSANTQAIADSMTRLAQLELLEVGQLIVDAPAGSQNCYGPCADDPVAQAWMQEHARQAARLEALVELAEQVASAPAEPTADVTEAVQALDALAIVEVSGPHYTSDGSCYVSVCPGDDEKRGRIEALSQAAQGL